MKTPEMDAAVERIAAGDRQPLYLAIGEEVVAMKAARRIADALAQRGGQGGDADGEVVVHKSAAGAELRAILADLFTFSLFGKPKISVVGDSAIFADKDAAADLIDEAGKALGEDGELIEMAGDATLSSRGKKAASRLLQALQLFEIDASAGTAEEAIAALPDSALVGGKAHRRAGRPKRAKKPRATLAAGLARLLEAARAEGLSGWSSEVLAELDRAASGSLPEGHALVLAERNADLEHPLVKRLGERKAVFQFGTLVFGRGGVTGLDAVVADLESETGVGIEREARNELVRRTLRKTGGWGPSEADANSAARFAAEYRKMADAIVRAEGRSDKMRMIGLQMVRDMVVDRGHQDNFELIDAVSAGNAQAAARLFHRYLDTAPDRKAALFMFFGLFANFCQQLATVHGIVTHLNLPDERNFNRFKTGTMPRLIAALPPPKRDSDSRKETTSRSAAKPKHPLAKLNPFRLFKVYQAAVRSGPQASRFMAELPWKVLETEVRLKGESKDDEVALQELVAIVAASGTAGGADTGQRLSGPGGQRLSGPGGRASTGRAARSRSAPRPAAARRPGPSRGRSGGPRRTAR